MTLESTREKNKVNRYLLSLILFFLMAAVCAPLSVSAEITEDVVHHTEMNYTGTENGRFGLELNDNNQLQFNAKYNSNTTSLRSYHTAGWYVTSVITNDARTVNHYYLDVSPGSNSVHDYNVSGNTSYDSHTLAYGDIKGMLTTLFGEGEDSSMVQVHYVIMIEVPMDNAVST